MSWLQRAHRLLLNFVKDFPRGEQSIIRYYGLATFNKTRFNSHSDFLRTCLHLGLTPKVLCPKPKCTVSNHLIHHIQKASYSYSKQLIRICIEDFSSKFDKEDDKLRQAKVALDSLNDIEQIISVKRKVHNLNKEVFNDFLSIKTKKLDDLKPFKEVSQENIKQVVTIPEDLQLSHDERKLLSRGLSFIPVNQNFNKSNTQEDLQRFFRRVKLHAHFNDPDKPITNIDDNEDSLLNKYKKSSSSWTPSDVHPSINNFISRCKEDIDNINSKKKIPTVPNQNMQH